jgi:dGTPase
MTDRYTRFHHSENEKPSDQRSPGRRDRDRILYSSSFRRLAGITQVISATDRFPIHNRLTHTLEVAQIGRSLAEQLLRDMYNSELLKSTSGLDPDVVEAACLAHDLGDPPFGHVAE